MKKTTKKKTPKTSSAEAHRVNVTFTPEEYEQLADAAAKIHLTPTAAAKLLIMQVLSGTPMQLTTGKETLRVEANTVEKVAERVEAAKAAETEATS